ncbi:MAG: hypothetical protein ABFD54_07080 [Armatimonadota bacterium]|nr:hypothetical protein [bacterium]
MEIKAGHTEPPLVRLVFSVLWNELKETIGSAPTATLLRRAIIISQDTCPVLARIIIEKNGREYRYEVPAEADLDPQTCDQIGDFVDTVLALLARLTGNVLVRQLLSNPLIRQLSEKEQ